MAKKIDRVIRNVKRVAQANHFVVARRLSRDRSAWADASQTTFSAITHLLDLGGKRAGSNLG